MNMGEKNLEKNDRKEFFLRKAILIGFFIYFFSSILREAIEEHDSWIIWSDLSQGKWWTFIRFFDPSWLLSYNFLGIPLVIGLIIGFYFGLKKRGRALFLYPILFWFISGIISGFLALLQGTGCDTCLSPAIALLGQTLFIFLCFSLITSVFLYFQKEKILFKINTILFVIIILGSLGAGKYLATKLSLKSEQNKESLEKQLSSLKNEAVRTGNIDLCEEVYKRIDKAEEEEQSGIIKGTIDLVPARHNYYLPCVKELAIKLKDESLCDRLEKSFNREEVEKCTRTAFLNKTDLCKEFGDEMSRVNCIRGIAFKTNNAELCKKIADKYCTNAIAVIINNPDACYDEYSSDCFTQIAVNSKDINVCKRDKSQTGMGLYPCIIKVAFKTNNPDLCKEITSEWHREECYKQFVVPGP